MSISTDFYKYPEPAGYVDAQDGTPLPYFVYGEENGGIPIFTLNGFSCCQPNLKYIIDGLSNQYKIISWDYKGHGLSQTPQSMTYVNFEGFVDDARRVLDATKTEKAIFLGYSMGAQLMFEFAFQNPDRIHGLISMNGTMGRVFDTFLKTDLLARFVPYLYWGLPNFKDGYQTFWNLAMKLPYEIRFNAGKLFFIDGENCDPEDMRPFLDQLAHLDVRVLITLAYEMHNHSTLNYLSRIEKPTLFLAGDNDLFAPLEVSEEAHQLVAGSKLVAIPDGSHNSNIERHDFIVDQMKSFLKELPNA